MGGHPPRARLALALAGALLLIGGWLRFITWPWQTHVWAIDFLLYYEPQARALSTGALHHWLFSWEGLHPPVTGAIHGALMAVGVPLAGQWLVSSLAMLGAGAALAWVVARATGVAEAGLLLFAAACISPLQANYGLTTSPYTTSSLFVALATAGVWWAADAPSPRRFVVAGALGGLALQSHVLALAVVGAHGLWLLLRGPEWLRTHRSAVLAWVGTVGLFSLPLLVAALGKTSDPWTFHEDTTEPFWGTLKLSLHERFGGRTTALAMSAGTGLLALAGLLRRPRGVAALLTLSGAAWVAALIAFMAMGVAAARQSHYFPTPHLLLAAAGLAGLAQELADRGGPLRAWGMGLAAACVLGWAGPAVAFQLERVAAASERLDEHAPAREAVREVYARAGEGDVVVYLWAYSFLNDEPEHLDPFAAWPLGRIGRLCRDVDVPRGLCVAGGGSAFFFDPTSFSGTLGDLDSALMQWVDQARAPGRATFIVVPEEDAGPHPWPVDRWLEGRGGAGEHHPGVSIWTMPAGLRLEQTE